MLAPGAPLVVTALNADFYPDLPCAYDDWCAVPEYDSGEAACPDMVVCMYDERAFRDLLESVFGAVATWPGAGAAVMFAECYV